MPARATARRPRATAASADARARDASFSQVRFYPPMAFSPKYSHICFIVISIEARSHTLAGAPSSPAFRFRFRFLPEASSPAFRAGGSSRFFFFLHESGLAA